MTLCNMTIEGGGRAGMVAPDDDTFEWFERTERPGAGAAPQLDEAIEGWRALRSDDGASFDREVVVDVARDLAAGDLGHQPRHGRRRRRPRARARRLRRARRPRRGRARARLHGPRGRHADRRRSASTASSSARARTRGSATCAPRPR